VIRIATRRSQLAKVQAWSVGEALKVRHGLDFSLLLLETKGDKWLDKPLQDLPGKDFFVEELDRALLEGRADLSVHSYKDLSTQRPRGLALAAVLKREDPRDILICHPSIQDRLRNGEKVRIGTSSPRRVYQAHAILPRLLPFYKKAAEIECLPLRGNVQTRLKRLALDSALPGAFDGIILALAGVKRAGLDLSGSTWMILPLTAFPTAPGQGALAVECPAEREDLKTFLKPLHHEETARLIQKERGMWVQAGGGCHQSFGVTWLRLSQGDWGRAFGGGHDAEWYVPDHFPILDPGPLWNGRKFRYATGHTSLPFSKPESTKACWWVSQSRALPPSFESDPTRDICFVPGLPTAYQLASRGHWVSAQAEGLGFSWFKESFPWEVFELKADEIQVLTHDQALTKWNGVHVYATHRMDGGLTLAAAEALRHARFVWWASGSQFERCKSLLREGVVHACGYGKTAEWLVGQGIRPYLFPHDGLWESYLMKGRQHEGASAQNT
jgi:hydroxymethylbilane synthase